MANQKIVIIMGSKSDLPFAQKIERFLQNEGLAVGCEFTVASAHRIPNILLEKLMRYEKSGDKIVFVTIAGLSDALSGVTAGFSMYPVIACPPDLDSLGWTKAFSSLATPIGVPVLLASKPENAALAAIKILALSDRGLQEEVERYIQKKRNEVVQADKMIKSDSKSNRRSEL